MVFCNERRRGSRWSWRWGVALGMCLAGCGPQPVEVAGSADEAQQAVRTALDAWVAGRQPADLSSGDRAIRVNDYEWQSGQRLKAYAPPATPQNQGSHWRVVTVLTLGGPRGTTVRRQAAYVVTLQPTVTVIRADDGDTGS